jgi:hypothetical protein
MLNRLRAWRIAAKTAPVMTAFGENTHMAEPIANDWKAIRDRMQQIKSEESASSQPCPRCSGRGWISDYIGRSACSCGLSLQKNLPSTGGERRGVPSRVTLTWPRNWFC